MHRGFADEKGVRKHNILLPQILRGIKGDL